MSALSEQILALAHLPSTEISKQLGCGGGYARRVLRRHGLSHPVGAPQGDRNPSWVGGRKVDADGYVLLAGQGRQRVLEHRAVMARVLGRPLQEGEVVDHIDGITIHNDPANLRLFASNGEHLAATASGARAWSAAGLANIGRRTDRGIVIQPVDTYRRRKARGDVRLLAILRAALELGTAHPCLSGTTHWLEQNGIDLHSRPSLEHALTALKRRYAADLRP